MRTRLKQRIYKRFMAGKSIMHLWATEPGVKLPVDIEQAIRDCVMQERESRGK